MTGKAPVSRPALVIGVGNRLRGDDGIGPFIVDLLRDHDLQDVEILECAGEGLELMEAWSGRDAVVVFDAVRGGDCPGTVHRIDARQDPMPDTWGQTSSHGVGVVEAVALSRILGRLPRELTVYGIEGRQFEPGTPLTAAVQAAGRRLVEAVVANLNPAC